MRIVCSNRSPCSWTVAVSCSVQSQGGFEMVGAYPAGYNWDMNYGKSQDEKQKAEANIKKVEIPTKDPVYGSKGPVLEHWTKK